MAERLKGDSSRPVSGELHPCTGEPCDRRCMSDVVSQEGEVDIPVGATCERLLGCKVVLLEDGSTTGVCQQARIGEVLVGMLAQPE